MTETRFASLMMVVVLACWPIGRSEAAEFSVEATALPYPPDTQKLEFIAWAGDIRYESPSPLKSIAAFYLKEMAARGWKHDESAVEMDDDSIELTFKHGEAQVELDLSQWSEAVHVRMDCEGLKFTGVDDPAKLAAAGVPVSPAALYLQKEVPPPDKAQDVQYKGNECQLKSTMTLQGLFDYYSRLVKEKRFRESRRPIITGTRRYTEFEKGSVKLGVNAFTHEIGSRVALTYEDQARTAAIPPLPDVASLPFEKAGAGKEPVVESMVQPATHVEQTPVDVTANKGSATVTYGGKKYTFPHIACYQDKDFGDDTTFVVFSAKPIPFHKLQTMVAKEDMFSFGDLYEFDFPEHFILQLGNYPSLTFSVNGVGIGGHSTENATGDMRAENGRVVGSLKMAPEEVLSSRISFTANVDAAIITARTRIAGPADPVMQSEHPALAGTDVVMPDGVENVSREGTNFRKTYHGEVAMAPDDVAAFYRKELPAKGWAAVESSDDAMHFKNDTTELSVSLKRQGSATAIEVVTRDIAAARKAGILPEPGMGRLVMANGHTAAVTYTIGETDYHLKPGQGAEDPKQALNYSVPPGTYNVIIKIPGQKPQTESIEMTAGATWGIITLPTGGYMPMRMY